MTFMVNALQYAKKQGKLHNICLLTL